LLVNLRNSTQPRRTMSLRRSTRLLQSASSGDRPLPATGLFRRQASFGDRKASVPRIRSVWVRSIQTSFKQPLVAVVRGDGSKNYGLRVQDASIFYKNRDFHEPKEGEGRNPQAFRHRGLQNPAKGHCQETQEAFLERATGHRQPRRSSISRQTRCPLVTSPRAESAVQRTPYAHGRPSRPQPPFSLARFRKQVSPCRSATFAGRLGTESRRAEVGEVQMRRLRELQGRRAFFGCRVRVRPSQ